MTDPAASAKAAALRYVHDDAPGIRRQSHGKRFSYVAPDGLRISDKRELARIRSLAIPPAYTDVWICPSANGHIQATGRDARGRKQYRYHKRWQEARDETKYNRMIAFAQSLPGIRKRVQHDLALLGLPREKVLATVVQLLESTAIRIGNDEYAKDNHSFGLTTLQNRHAVVSGTSVRFTFNGKSGVRHAIDLRDKRLAKVIRQCQDLPGQQLFEYVDDNGEPHGVDSADVNDYIREISGDEFSAKDFRTWLGTVSCALLLAKADSAETQAERKAQLALVIKDVAKRLGNTPAVCRKCYVHPGVLASYMEGGRLSAPQADRHEEGLASEERFVLQILNERTGEGDSARTLRQMRQTLAGRKKRAA